VSVLNKILIVDDDRFTRGMLRMVLSAAGYDVSLAEDGKSAVAMAAAQKPDLVLTDGLLPKLHGFEVCKALKQFKNPPKVILLTGIYTKPSYAIQIMRDYGADAVLQKGLASDELLACIQLHLNPKRPESGSATRLVLGRIQTGT
jgi:DNA-binding response OmpR family regulator